MRYLFHVSRGGVFGFMQKKWEDGSQTGQTGQTERVENSACVPTGHVFVWFQLRIKAIRMTYRSWTRRYLLHGGYSRHLRLNMSGNVVSVYNSLLIGLPTTLCLLAPTMQNIYMH